ncbi:MAG: hypothetical protein JWQ26_2617, partial [Modestobacter sp.]|nr:hypothetical protein [Modestobacter sp.]
MTVSTLAVLAVLVVAGTLLALRGERVRGPVGAVLLLLLLAAAALVAWRAAPASDTVRTAGLLLAVAAA